MSPLCDCHGVEMVYQPHPNAADGFGYWRCRVRLNEWRRGRVQHYRQMIYDHYGNVCACCGETEPLFLTIDHMNGRAGEPSHGRTHTLRGTTMLRQIIREWPDDIQILCFNCNSGRERNGGICPHKA